MFSRKKPADVKAEATTALALREFDGECEVFQIHDRFVIKAAGTDLYWGRTFSAFSGYTYDAWTDSVRFAHTYKTLEIAIKKAEEFENEYKRRRAIPVKVWRCPEKS